MKIKNAFTLIELIIVVSIISILAIVVLVGLKPALRMAEARDARRAQDVNQILTGILSCVIDKKDSSGLTTCLGTHTTGKTYEIVSGAVTTNCNTVCGNVIAASDCLTLNTTLTDYFVALPADPSNTASGHTGYSLTNTANGMVVIEACAAEIAPIKVSR